MKSLYWKTIPKTVNELIPQEINPRVMSDKQMSDLKRSLSKYGLVEIPAIDLDGKILAGHMRIKALKMLGKGDEIIDCRVPSRKLSEKEAKEYLIASNKISGEWEIELLKSFDMDVLEFAGFDKIELSEMWDSEKEVIDDNFEVEKELKKIKKPTTKLGDLIHLGNSRVICGDSTNPDTLKRLFGEDRASMIYSDPVYNLDYQYDLGMSGNKNYGGDVKDFRTFEEYKKFLKDSMECALAVSNKDIHVFYFCDQVYIGVVQDLYRQLGIENKRVCIWLKNNQNCVPQVAFNKVYEPVVYGVLNKPYLAKSITNLTEVMNKEMRTGNDLHYDVNEFIDVWVTKRLSANQYTHATEKPVQLHERAIKRCTKINDIILDSFLGSGSTLIAGESLGRRVYGCELEPQFCDLIIRRYEKLTGRKAIIEHYEKR